MEPTIKFYEFLLECLRQLAKMIESENIPSIFHPKSQEIVRELLSSISDYTAIIEQERIKLRFWDWVLSDPWARTLYYLEPDGKNWDDKEVDNNDR